MLDCFHQDPLIILWEINRNVEKCSHNVNEGAMIPDPDVTKHADENMTLLAYKIL